jgi:hypothetical protein
VRRGTSDQYGCNGLKGQTNGEDRHGPRAENVSLGADHGHVSDWGNGTFPVTAPTLLRAVRKRDRDPIPRNGSHDYI